jgi:hypothetical protein
MSTSRLGIVIFRLQVAYVLIVPNLCHQPVVASIPARGDFKPSFTTSYDIPF